MAWSVVCLAMAWVAYASARFALFSPEMALIHPEQVAITGNHYVPRASVLEVFAGDRGKSVLRIPLDERRRRLESIAWVEQAAVRRALPNKIQVDITERTPIAFLRDGGEMALVDVHGTVLDPPLEGDFHFPVVTGIQSDMPQEDREARMHLFSGFAQQIQSVRGDAMEQVSEVDLSDEHDVRATLVGLRATGVSSAEALNSVSTPVLVHFGDTDFAAKYRTLIERIGEWSATAGTVESVDLRFNGQAVVNPDMAKSAAQPPAKPAAAKPAKPGGKKPADHPR